MSAAADKMHDVGDEDQGTFERVIRADERARDAHRRLDRLDVSFERVESRLGGIEVAVGKLNVKVAGAAAVGSLIGGGAIAVLVSVISTG